MSHEVGELLIGKVINVKPYALFLEFEDGVQGLLHISEISDAFIRDIERFGTKGDELRVKVLSVDETNGFLRVSLKRVEEQDFYSTHKNLKRNVPEFDESDFKALEEKLPEWIETTLKKAKEEDND